MNKKRRKRETHPEFLTNQPETLPDEDQAFESGNRERIAGGGDIHAAGTPGGGSEVGGLAGTNVGNGAPGNVNLEEFLGDGNAEEELERLEGNGPPYSGPAGGAVGGTPAEGRTAGGSVHHGIAPEGVHRGDSTIGAPVNSQAEEEPRRP
jgi:hypothetical protein